MLNFYLKYTLKYTRKSKNIKNDFKSQSININFVKNDKNNL